MPPRSRRGDPTPVRWLIGVELARHRSAAGLSMAEAGQRVGISKPKLAHMETGRQHQSTADIAKLLALYGVGEEETGRLSALVPRAEEGTWWTGTGHPVPEFFRNFLGLERIATHAFTFEPALVPGLLQTEDYARAVLNSSILVRTSDAESLISLRQFRAQRLTAAQDPLHLHVVMTESALRLRVGSVATHRAQLEHLQAVAELPNVTVQVLLPESGYHDALNGRFVLLDFREVRTIGFAETIEGALYIHDPDQVHTCALVSDQIAQLALGSSPSVELVAKVAGNLTA